MMDLETQNNKKRKIKNRKSKNLTKRKQNLEATEGSND